MPLLSIIIPTYNSEKTIAQCLQSIVCQTFQSFEIVIQDGVSTDGTLGLLYKIMESNNPHVAISISSEKDGGVYDAMNKAMRRAVGEWVLFLGSDDSLYDATVLEELFNSTDLNNRSVIYGNVKIVGDNTWAKDGEIYDGKFQIDKLINKNICHQSIFYRREFAAQIGSYNTSYKLCADWDYNLRCWAKTEFLYVNKIIANFQAGGETTKRNDDKNFERDFLSNITLYFNISLTNPILNNTKFRYFHQVQTLRNRPLYTKVLNKIIYIISVFVKK